MTTREITANLAFAYLPS